MEKLHHLVLMSYWRPVSNWFVGYLRENNVKKIAYIMNADRQRLAENNDFVFYDFDFFQNSGFEVDLVDLDKEKDLVNVFKDKDLIYVRGGNTFELLDSVRNSGFDSLLPKLLESGVIYASSSAGSILPGPSIEIADNDFAPDYNSVGLKDMTGLGLVDFAIFPHWEERWRQKLNLLKSERKVNYPVKTLVDNQVVIIKNGKEEFLSI